MGDVFEDETSDELVVELREDSRELLFFYHCLLIIKREGVVRF